MAAVSVIGFVGVGIVVIGVASRDGERYFDLLRAE